MMQRKGKRFHAVERGEDSPINFAVSSRDKSVLDMVAHAIAHKETFLTYQPVILCQSPDKPAFYEGLIRVKDETGRIIPAKDFMSVVETSELGRKLDCLALEIGLRTLANNPGLRLSINMSARSIGYRRWMRVLDRGLNRNPTLAERLILEINETSAMQVPELVVDFMKRLQSRGISFALDGVGAGVTSLRHLKDFYFDMIKIDGQFIRGIATHPDNQILVRAMIAIAEQFEMVTVAEHVETAEDVTMLVSLGVDCMQGYFFGSTTTSPQWAAPDHRQKGSRASA